MSIDPAITINEAWNELFKRHNILERISLLGYFRISAQEINQVKEARLMAKFDQSTQLPKIFRDHGLSILPVARGHYQIGAYRTYEPINYPVTKPVFVEIPDLETLDYTNLYSEASALIFAYNSGIIQDVIDSERISFTVNGRMSSGEFSFYIDNNSGSCSSSLINVANSQIEIDAGYESHNAFCICEAKNIAVEDLLIRQLYYPYRLWKTKINKKIIPVHFIFSNDIFHVFKYDFYEPDNYNSLHLVQYRTYTFANEEVYLSEVIELWRSIVPLKEPNHPFPQADSFERLVDLLSVLYDSPLTHDEVTMKYVFDPRQTSYYIAAGEYLGFVERAYNADGVREFKLTNDAYKIMKMGYKQKHLAMIRRILERPVFYRAFECACRINQIPDKPELCTIMNSAELNINSVTIERRSSTVRSWLNWIFRISQ